MARATQTDFTHDKHPSLYYHIFLDFPAINVYNVFVQTGVPGQDYAKSHKS